ncbi:MAG: glycosyltransferase [Methanobacterium sp. ERen5]|nr:MAG: glycosyltransferase [Methanobacterium sp. ERen5]
MGIVHKNSETNKKECLLSVIIRTHNSENVIEKAIESVLEQTISKDIYELIIIDDDSADNTENKIKSHDNKIKFIKGKKLGPIKAINIGIKESRGKYYVLLDSDDTFELNALEELLNTIKQNNCDCVYSDYHEIDVEKNEIKTISLKNNILNGIAAGVIFKKKSVNEVNNYDEELFS